MHSKELLLKTINAVLFNVAWLFCVLGGNQVALATAATLLVIHLLFIAPAWSEVLLLMMLAALGIAIDTLWFVSGVLVNADGSEMVPVWLCALWICFSTTCAHCFTFLHERLLLAAVLGGVFGTSSYWVGVSLSEVSLGVSPFVALCALAAVWALLFPGMLMIAKAFGKGEENVYG